MGRQPWALSLPDKELCLREALAVSQQGRGLAPPAQSSIARPGCELQAPSCKRPCRPEVRASVLEGFPMGLSGEGTNSGRAGEHWEGGEFEGGRECWRSGEQRWGRGSIRMGEAGPMGEPGDGGRIIGGTGSGSVQLASGGGLIGVSRTGGFFTS